MFLKEITKIKKKIKKFFKHKFIQVVLVSLSTAIFVIIVILLLFWSNRTKIVNFLASEYKIQHPEILPAKIPEIIEEPVEEQILKEIEETKEELPTVINAVKKAKPAVVSILVTDAITKKKLGSGSGFIISSDGLIVTNRHVVQGTGAILTILLNNGKEYEAIILDRDPVLDVALIKIMTSNLPYLKLADSDTLEVGETVIAIGNALGEFKNSVSVGVVSGLSRSITAGDNAGQKEFLDKVIQTDAAINRGNSGGPLLNIYGDVVGINVALVEKSASIGFSLPINSVKDVINSVKKTGKITRPYIGIRYNLITPPLQLEYNLPYDYGIIINKGLKESDSAIIPNSPADKAGLKEGDIILEIDGIKITEEKNFSYLIRNKKIGDFLMMKVYSSGVEKTAVVVLEKAPDNF